MTVLPQCFRCRHLHGGAAYQCDAFPDGIPEPILTNEHDHRQPYDGDHGVRFEAKDGESTEATPPTGAGIMPWPETETEGPDE